MPTNQRSTPQHSSLLSLLLEHGLWIRWAAALLGGVIVAVLSPATWSGEIRFLVAWDVAILIALSPPWWIILRSDTMKSQMQARQTDPGNIGLLAISVLVSAASIIGVVFVLADERAVAYRASVVANALVVSAIFGGWALLQTAFTLHYARVYYTDSEKPGGLDFPGGPPDDLDFAYFAFGVGISGQVSDVSTTSQRMRRLVLAHSILSFVYNLAILGLMVNLLAGRL